MTSDSDFPTAIVVHHSMASQVVFHHVSRFLIAAILRIQDRLWLTLFAYLPHRHHPPELYDEALSSIEGLIRRIPYKACPKNIIIGLGANVEVPVMQELRSLVGEAATGMLLTSRATRFLDFCLSFELKLANT